MPCLGGFKGEDRISGAGQPLHLRGSSVAACRGTWLLSCLPVPDTSGVDGWPGRSLREEIQYIYEYTQRGTGDEGALG